MDMAETIISLKDINLSLKSNAGLVHILKDINLDFNAGESVGLTGRSCSG